MSSTHVIFTSHTDNEKRMVWNIQIDIFLLALFQLSYDVAATHFFYERRAAAYLAEQSWYRSLTRLSLSVRVWPVRDYTITGFMSIFFT